LKNHFIEETRMSRFTSLIVPACLALLFCTSALAQDQLPRQEWGAPLVTVAHNGDTWTINGQKQTVSLDGTNLALKIQAGPASWAMVPSAPTDMIIKLAGEQFPLRLADAGKIDVVPYDTGFKTGVKITLSDWQHAGAPLDLKLFLTICLEGKDEDLVCTATAQEGAAALYQLDWPTALDASQIDYTALSNRRGVLLPRNYPQWYFPDRAKQTETTEIQSNLVECWSMSWWGFAKGPSAMMAIVETPNDAAYQFDHPAGGPTVIGPRWRETLGRFGYTRSVRFVFFPQGNYVTMAKRYRQYVINKGLLITLKQKIAMTPDVAKIIGTPSAHVSILRNIVKDSMMYSTTEPSANYRLTTFDQAADRVTALKKQGWDHLWVAMSGWPHEGYDRQHPDELPPCPPAGGWEGMKRFQDTCEKLGYLFLLHDQYRDYYPDAPSFDEQFAVHDEDPSAPPNEFPGTRYGQWKKDDIDYMNRWMGGTQTFINNQFMLGHLMKNYAALFAHGIHPQGAFLDVLGYISPDEDFNPEHPTSRTQAMAARYDVYAWSRANLGVIGTEAGCDWTMPYADFTTPLTSRKAIPVPLYNLVYHDAIVIPYPASDLRGFLEAGVPSLGYEDRDPTPEELTSIHRMASLHARVGLLEMTNHEFLTDDHNQERTTFADGTTVTVDWKAKTVQINPDVDVH
jgi:Family of unknown function (DUF5696)